MTPDDVRAIREALGLSVGRMAELLGLGGARAADTLREIERGARPVNGTTTRLLMYIQQGLDLELDAREHDLTAQVLPRWLDCADLESDAGAEIVAHTRYPRFYALFLEALEKDEVRRGLEGADAPVDVVEFSAGSGLPPALIVWLDEPVAPTGPLLAELRALKEAQARRDLED